MRRLDRLGLSPEAERLDALRRIRQEEPRVGFPTSAWQARAVTLLCVLALVALVLVALWQ